MRLGARLVLHYRREQQVLSPLERLEIFDQSGNAKMYFNSQH